ncbi:MAG: imidazole glycerol phosphate synthase subunit HisH [Candidatus Omnitrophica bacterium]|nr:imidazole glycerol phosphate synthase subunit HisH [Candidatus Omnitrophota bacterium]
MSTIKDQKNYSLVSIDKRRNFSSYGVIGIVDYAMGNIHSVKKAVEFCGASVRIITKPKELKSIDKLILPGVGAFGDALNNLKKMKLYEALLEYLEADRVFLGICLGMQILFENSQEDTWIKGLGFLKGKILRFKINKNLKVPHMGWNKLNFKNRNCPLLKDLPDNAYVYFCHSFYPKPQDRNIICATTNYGIEFASIIQKSNIYGVQFHPEKSQKVGLKIMQNFVRL